MSLNRYPQQRKAQLPLQLQAQLLTLACGLMANQPCPNFGVGGVRRALVAERTELLVSLLNNSGQVSDFNSKPLTIWYPLYQPENSLKLEFERVNDENGVVYNSKVTGRWYQLTTTHSIMISKLSNTPLAMLLEDKFGVWWLLGRDQPVRLKNVRGTTGSGQTDANGYEFEFSVRERFHPFEVLTDAVESLTLDPDSNCSIPYVVTLPVQTYGTCDIDNFLTTII